MVEIIDVTSDGIARTNTPFVWNPKDDRFYFKKNSKIFEKISMRYGISLEGLELEFRRRVQLMYKLYQNKYLSLERFKKSSINIYKKTNLKF